MHLSGGTTEFLLCSMDPAGYELEIIGGTKDISIGQFIDRSGVAMGYPFPAGAYLDLAAQSFIHDHTLSDITGKRMIPEIRIKDGYFNLSGPETSVLRTIENSDESEYPGIAYEMFDKTAGLLAAAACELADRYDVSRIYMAGGVSSSSYIRNSIRDKLRSDSPEIVFGSPELSGDNAVGIARLARRLHETTRQDNNR
jgi:N6-L-threonylcarbamoyladenine synthase